MDYAGMANRLAQYRQAQVPGGGMRPMQQPNAFGGPRGSGMGPGFMQGQMGMAPQASGLAGGALQSQGRPNPYMTHPPMGGGLMMGQRFAPPAAPQGGIMAALKNRMGGGA